jgi:hypothetical protein
VHRRPLTFLDSGSQCQIRSFSFHLISFSRNVRSHTLYIFAYLNCLIVYTCSILSMYDRCFYRTNVRTLADVPDRLNGRLGLQQTNYDQVDRLPQHIASVSLAVALHTPSQGLDDMVRRSMDLEVCVCVVISHDWGSNCLQLLLLPHLKSLLPILSISVFDRLNGEGSSGIIPEEL